MLGPPWITCGLGHVKFNLTGPKITLEALFSAWGKSRLPNSPILQGNASNFIEELQGNQSSSYMKGMVCISHNGHDGHVNISASTA